MKEFKFFKGTLNMIDGDVRATASFNDDTPEGYMNRRMLYHTNPDLYDRLRHPNNEMEQYFYDRNLRSRFGTPERHQDILRRLQMTNDSRDLNDNPIRLFQTTSVTTVNPKWWIKIKMFFQDNQDMFAVIFFAAAVTICFGLIIGKILNAW
jgi:hypothetical protein